MKALEAIGGAAEAASAVDAASAASVAEASTAGITTVVLRRVFAAGDQNRGGTGGVVFIWENLFATLPMTEDTLHDRFGASDCSRDCILQCEHGGGQRGKGGGATGTCAAGNKRGA